jgi:LPXTG-motif cell wall-anchored protein
LTFRAVVALVVFGGIWVSVRGQHPYTGHISGWAVAVAVVLVAINIGWTAWAIGRAGTGVSGPAQRKWEAWVGISVAAWIIGYAVTAPLYHAAVSHPVWGLYPASAPLLIIGLAAAAAAAAFGYWPLAGVALGIAVVAAAAGFGGPAGSWLILAIGLCAMMLGTAGFLARARRRSVGWP